MCVAAQWCRSRNMQEYLIGVVTGVLATLFGLVVYHIVNNEGRPDVYVNVYCDSQAQICPR